MKLHLSEPTKHHVTGKIGAMAFLSLDQEAGYDGHYTFGTFGMKPEDVKAKVDALRAHHAKKSARIDGFAGSVRNHKIKVKARSFTVVDCTLWEAGDEVELYVDVREVGAEDQRVSGFPLIKRFASIDVVPDNETIIALATTIVSDRVTTESAHNDYTARVKALLDVR